MVVPMYDATLGNQQESKNYTQQKQTLLYRSCNNIFMLYTPKKQNLRN
jgi:hypothetical protein